MAADAANDAPVVAAFPLTDAEERAVMDTMIDTPSGHLGPWLTLVEHIVAARLAPVAALADEWTSDPVGGDLWRADAVDALRSALKFGPARATGEEA